jgi:hypothetical protein
VIELDVLDPTRLLRVCDDANRGDAYAVRALSAVAEIRRDITQGDCCCIACDRRLWTTKAVTYCIVLAGDARVIRSVICEACTDEYSRRDLCIQASNSLAAYLHGGTLHEAGHA